MRTETIEILLEEAEKIVSAKNCCGSVNDNSIDIQNWYRVRKITEILGNSQYAVLLGLVGILDSLNRITDLLERGRPLTEEGKPERL